MKKHLTRREYREKKDKYGSLKVLTDEEFDKLSLYDRSRYAKVQMEKGLPVTVEQDTHWDNPEHPARKYVPKPVFENKQTKKSIIVDFLGKFLILDFVLRLLGLSK